jgi:hypothetical protein
MLGSSEGEKNDLKAFLRTQSRNFMDEGCN